MTDETVQEPLQPTQTAEAALPVPEAFQEPVERPEPTPEQVEAYDELRRLQAHVRLRGEIADVLRSGTRAAQAVAREHLHSVAEGRCVGPGCHAAEEALAAAERVARQTGYAEIADGWRGLVADARKAATDALRQRSESYARYGKPFAPPPAAPNPESIFQEAYRRAWQDFQQRQQPQSLPEEPWKPLL